MSSFFMGTNAVLFDFQYILYSSREKDKVAIIESIYINTKARHIFNYILPSDKLNPLSSCICKTLGFELSELFHKILVCPWTYKEYFLI